jgi:hypothetical protein
MLGTEILEIGRQAIKLRPFLCFHNTCVLKVSTKQIKSGVTLLAVSRFSPVSVPKS